MGYQLTVNAYARELQDEFDRTRMDFFRGTASVVAVSNGLRELLEQYRVRIPGSEGTALGGYMEVAISALKETAELPRNCTRHFVDELERILKGVHPDLCPEDVSRARMRVADFYPNAAFRKSA